MRGLVLALACCLGCPAFAADTTDDGKLREVRSIYLGDFGRVEGADIVREKVRLALAGSSRFVVVEREDAADAVLTGAAGVSSSIVPDTVDGGTRTAHTGHATLRLVHRAAGVAIWYYQNDRVWGWGSRSTLLAEDLVKELLKAAKRADAGAQ